MPETTPNTPKGMSVVEFLERSREAHVARLQAGLTGRIWHLFNEVSLKVGKTHEDDGVIGHHDWVHAFRVGEMAHQIAHTEWGDERLSHLAGIAGLSHNADRIIQQRLKVGRGEVPREAVVALVAEWVRDVMNAVELDTVTDAVLKHSGRNSADDSQVLIALMDGDRVTNLSKDLYFRSGQYYPDLPAVDYKHFLSNPTVSYRSPGSVLQDMAYSLEWADPTSRVGVRTKLGLAMASKRAAKFRRDIEELKDELTEEGILF